MLTKYTFGHIQIWEVVLCNSWLTALELLGVNSRSPRSFPNTRTRENGGSLGGDITG